MLQRDVLLTLHRDDPPSEFHAELFRRENTLDRLKALDSRVRRKGLDSLDPARSELIRIGMEVNGRGRVTKNGYGVLNLSWQAQRHPEWAEQVRSEAEEIRQRIRETHKCPLRFLIWAGMGGSAEDKNMYNAAGLLTHGPRCYVLDSTDPAKLKHILEDIVRRSGVSLAEALRGTLVVGMAMGMTSYEAVVNLEKLSALYEKHRIDPGPNFLTMTLPGSLLDRLARERGYRKVEFQLDNDNTTAGRHSGPLTRGSLIPLALARNDLRAWIEGAVLTEEEIHTAWRLAAFLHAQGEAGRDKVTLLLPKPWAGAAVWTKQDFEESLGKCECAGIKIVIGEKVRLANYRSPKDPRQDRLVLAVHVKGAPATDAEKITQLRRSGYPVAVLTAPRGSLLSHYMQFIHYTVFGLGRLRRMNFVTQPSVELYKSIANRLYASAQKAGGLEKTTEWQKMQVSPRQARYRGGITLYYDRLPLDPMGNSSAPAVYAGMLHTLALTRCAQYGELTFFGDTRYSPRGRAVRKVLDRAAEEVFHARLKMPADVYEGPAMNHSYHEMVIGHGGCFSTILLPEKAERLPEAGHTADYHRAQFLATLMALEQRGRPVVSITLRDLEDASLAALGEFFHQVAVHLKALPAQLPAAR